VDNETERILVEKAKSDPEAFGKIFDLYYSKILKYCIYRTFNVEVARDVTSETFFKALKNLHQFKWTGVHFSAWLYRIASNEINMYFRHKKYEPTSLEAAVEDAHMPELASKKDLETEIIDAQEKLDKTGDLSLAVEALQSLPVKYREVITLRFFQELSINEISKLLYMKEGTVKSILSRGIKMLKQKAGAQPNRGSSIVYVKAGITGEGE
jgi:RNA polymerase sigma-70 factor, ECF subfamily